MREAGKAAACIDIVALHAYVGDNKGFLPVADRTGDFHHARAVNKPIWQTEISAFDKNDITMKDGLYWAQLLPTRVTDN